MRDEVDDLVEAWGRERGDLDLAPVEVFSRISRLSRHLDLARRDAFTAHGIESWEFDVLAALRRAARKVLARVEKQLERIAAREAELHAEMEANLSDYDLLARVGDQLGELAAEKDELEMEWLEASEAVE